MAKQMFLSINMPLSCGVYVFNAKVRVGTPLVTLLVTDFHSNARIVMDIEQKTVLTNKYDIKMEKKDIEALVEVLVKKMAKPVASVVDTKAVS